MTLYASTSQIKAALRITDSVDDALISMAGSAASSLIDGYCGRTFGTVAEVRYFAPDNGYLLHVDDLAGTAITVESSTVSDQVFDVTWAPTDYQLEPLNGETGGLTWPYTRLRAIDTRLWPYAWGEATVRITGTWGWPSVPPTIMQAAVIQAMRIFRRLDSPLGVAGFGDMGAIRVSRGLDPDVAQLVQPFVKHEGVA